MRDALVVEATEGERWNLALTILRNGSGHVRYRSVELSRPYEEGAGPVHVAIDSVGARPHHDEADQAVAAGLAHLQELRDESPDLDNLCSSAGLLVEYVYDYGDGAATLGSVDNGTLHWADS